MELMQKILIERITDVGQLAVREQEQVMADPALQAAIRENLGLARLKRVRPWSPDREAVLRNALSSKTEGGRSMRLIGSLFAGRAWHFRLGVALLLLAAVTLLALLPRSSTWAQTNGFVLKFDYGQVVAPDSADEACEAIDEQLDSLNAAVMEWAEARKAEKKEDDGHCEVMLNVNIDNGYMTAMVALVDADSKALDDLAAWLSGVPGVPTPTVSDATWFHPGGKLDPSAGISFNLMDHLFSFPNDASELEIERTINDWLKENKPEFGGEVDVTISRSGESGEGAEEQQKIKVMIKLKEAPEK